MLRAPPVSWRTSELVASCSCACLPACPTSRLSVSSSRLPRSPVVAVVRDRHFRSRPSKRSSAPASALERPSPVARSSGWLHRVESVDGTPWLSPLSVAPLRPELPLSPASPRSGRRRRIAAGCLCHSSQWFFLAKALRPCCTDQTLSHMSPPEGTDTLDGSISQGSQGVAPDRSSSRRPVSLASWRPPCCRLPTPGWQASWRCRPRSPQRSLGPAFAGYWEGAGQPGGFATSTTHHSFCTSKISSKELFSRCHRQSTRQSGNPIAGPVPALGPRIDGVLADPDEYERSHPRPAIGRIDPTARRKAIPTRCLQRVSILLPIGQAGSHPEREHNFPPGGWPAPPAPVPFLRRGTHGPTDGAPAGARPNPSGCPPYSKVDVKSQSPSGVTSAQPAGKATSVALSSQPERTKVKICSIAASPAGVLRAAKPCTS